MANLTLGPGEVMPRWHWRAGPLSSPTHPRCSLLLAGFLHQRPLSIIPPVALTTEVMSYSTCTIDALYWQVNMNKIRPRKQAIYWLVCLLWSFELSHTAEDWPLLPALCQLVYMATIPVWFAPIPEPLWLNKLTVNLYKALPESDWAFLNRPMGAPLCTVYVTNIFSLCHFPASLSWGGE